jgi:hypothetical protein
MNAKTLEAIRRHGQALLAAFPNATEKDPLVLCKKLRRIETAIGRVILDYTNGENGVTLDALDAACIAALGRVCGLLTLGADFKARVLFINRDPRGYALKLDSDWTDAFNKGQFNSNLPGIHRDMGGYGILAPDLQDP